MNITKVTIDNETIVSVVGGITAATVSDFDTKLNEEVKGFPGNLVLHLVDVNYINSSGLRVVLTLAKEYAARKLTFSVKCKRDIFQIFDTVGFSKIIKINVVEA